MSRPPARIRSTIRSMARAVAALAPRSAAWTSAISSAIIPTSSAVLVAPRSRPSDRTASVASAPRFVSPVIGRPLLAGGRAQPGVVKHDPSGRRHFSIAHHRDWGKFLTNTPERISEHDRDRADQWDVLRCRRRGRRSDAAGGRHAVSGPAGLALGPYPRAAAG